MANDSEVRKRRQKELLRLLTMAPSSARARHSATPVESDWDKEAVLRQHTTRKSDLSKDYPDWGSTLEEAYADKGGNTQLVGEPSAISTKKAEYAKQLEAMEGYSAAPYPDSRKILTTGIGVNLDALEPSEKAGKWDKKDPNFKEEARAKTLGILRDRLPEADRAGFTGDNLTREQARLLKEQDIAKKKELIPSNITEEKARIAYLDQLFRGLSADKQKQIRDAYKAEGISGMRKALYDIIETGDHDRGNDVRTLRAIRLLEKENK